MPRIAAPPTATGKAEVPIPPTATGPANILQILSGVKRKASELADAGGESTAAEETPKKVPKAAAKAKANATTPPKIAQPKPDETAQTKIAEPKPNENGKRRQKAKALLVTNGAPPQQEGGASQSSADCGSQMPKGQGKGKTAVKKEERPDDDDEGERVPYEKLTLSEKRKFRSQFDRTVVAGDHRTEENVKRRKPRGEKAPEWVVLQMQAEPGMRESWFQRWYEAKTWKNVVLQEEYIKEEEKQQGKVFAWLTEAQLADHYKDEYVAKCIAAKKKKTYGAHKVHPEVPELKEAMLLKCWFSEQEAEILRQKHVQISRAETELDDEAADTHMNHVGQLWAPSQSDFTKDQSVSAADEPPFVKASEVKKKAEEEERAKKHAENLEAEKLVADAERAKKETEAKLEAQKLEAEAKLAADAEAKAKKAEDKRKKAELDAQDPRKRSDKMLAVMNTFLGQLAVQSEILQGASKFDDAVKSSFGQKFQKAKDGLKRLRSLIEEHMQAKHFTGLDEALLEANGLNEKLKEDLAAFRVLHRTMYPKPKTTKPTQGENA